MRIELGRKTIEFTLLAFFISTAFLLGGSARDDVLSLVLLRPIGVAFFVIAFVSLPSDVRQRNRWAIMLALALPLLTLIHLIPLPPFLWHMLPGRELIWDIGIATQIEQPWRPISLVPYRTWNSLWSFAVPLAAFLLALSASRGTYKLVYVIAAIVLVSGVLGLLQSIGGQGNGFYLYRVTNADSAVGLFANRNHQAMLLAIAFPVLAAAASLSKGSREAAKPKRLLAIGLGIMIIPFILVTGSRAGLLLGLAGIVSAFLVYRNPAAHLQSRRVTVQKVNRFAGLGIVGAGLVLITALVGRDSSLQRLFAVDAAEDLRFRVWAPIAEAAWQYFPVGSGIGTFVEIYKVIEPNEYLSPLYLNHAHNDWLELALTGGAPALLILAVAGWIIGRRLWRVFISPPDMGHADLVTARLGGAIVFILALGSVYDYPLRVPSLASLFAIAAVWLLRDDEALNGLASNRR